MRTISAQKGRHSIKLSLHGGRERGRERALTRAKLEQRGHLDEWRSEVIIVGRGLWGDEGLMLDRGVGREGGLLI